MKKMLIFFILLTSIVYTQTPVEYNLSLYTGDYTTFQFQTANDISTYRLLFVAKANNNIYSARLIEKKNSVNGGNDTQIKVVYSGQNRYRTYVYIQGTDTDTLAAEYYYYDLVQIDPIDTLIQRTLFTGRIQFKHQVQSPYDNTYADERAVFRISQGTIQNETIIWDIATQMWIPSGDTLSTGGGTGTIDTTYIYEAIGEKAPSVSPTFTGTVTLPQGFWLTEGMLNIQIDVTGAEFNRLKGVTGPIQTQLNSKESTISTGLSSQYFRGDKTWVTLDKSAVGLSNVTNESKATMFESAAFTTAISLPSTISIGGTQLIPSITELNYVDGVTSNIQTQINNVSTSLDGEFDVDENGDLMPKTTITTSHTFEEDPNGDLMPQVN